MKKISSDIIIISILWLSIAVSLFLNPNYNPQFIFGIVGLLIVTLTHTKFPEFSFGVFALILFLSIFNVVSFNYAFGLNFGIFSIPSILLFAILFFTQIDRFYELIRNWGGENEPVLKNEINSKVQIFKKQFQNFSESELRRKFEDDNLVNEAKIAITELLNEKK